MRQVLQDRSGSTVVREVPPPPCPPGSLLVRNAFSVISTGTERARAELSGKSLLGKARERPDLVREVVSRARKEGIRATRDAVRRRLSEETPVGYSSAGVVLEIGETVRAFDPGDRVACAGGGHACHAEIVSVPVNLCARVPPTVSLEAAAMTTIGAVALHGVRLADVGIGDRVAVVGCGLVGQFTCRLLQAAGAEVVALDVDPARVAQALAGGAHHGVVVGDSASDEVLALTGGVGVDEVVITAAAQTNEPLLLACAVARDRAAVVLVGDVPIQSPRAAFYDKELSFRVSRSYGPGRYDLEYEERGLDYPIGFVRWTEQRNMEAVLGLQARGALLIADLVDEVVPIQEAPRAYARLTGEPSQRPRGAIVISYGEAEDAYQAGQAAQSVSVNVPARAATSGAEGPIRVGLIGPGSFASRVLVPALVSGGARLELVGGGSGPSAEVAARTLGFARVGADDLAVVTDSSVDAVVIATRHSSHAKLTAGALRAGKHVFCEKPLALTMDELEDVLAAAADSSTVVAVGFNRRFSPSLRAIREFLAPGEGKRVTASYRVAAGALSPDHWAHDLAQGGGRILGEVCHFVDSLAYLVGAPVVRVYATGYGSAEVPVQSRDNVVVTLTFADGSSGTVTYVADGSPRLAKERLEAFCGERAAVLDDFVKLELLGPDGRRRTTRKTQDKGHTAEIAAFLAGVRSGILPVALSEIANVSVATLAVVESLRTGDPVRVTAESE